MKIAIVIESWKLSIFERRLAQAGYEITDKTGLTASTIALKVHTVNADALAIVVQAANTEAQMTGAPQ